jgi:hypothetical protein
MKTKNKSIDSLIKAGKFDFVSDYAKNFPYEEPREGDTKVFHFDREITSEEATAEMHKEGYEPMLASELLEYAADGWNGTDFVVALGTTWLDPSGNHDVLVLGEWGRVRGVDCDWFDDGWHRSCRFAARRPRKSTHLSETQSLALDPLTLVSEIEERLTALKKSLAPTT